MKQDALYDNDADYERAKKYSRIRDLFSLADLALSAALALLALETGVSAAIRRRTHAIGPAWLRPAIPYAALMLPLSFAASLPLSYVRGFIIEHRFGLSHQTRRAWALDQLKVLGLSFILGLPLIHGLYVTIKRFPHTWWAIVSAVMVPLTVILGALAPIVILPLFNRFEPLRDQALATRLRELAAREHVRVADVLQMDMSKQTAKANAFFTGFGQTKRIVLGDTLLDALTPDEIEVVVAHELGHQVHRDLWKGIAVGALATVASTLLIDRAAPPLLRRFGARWGLEQEQGLSDVAALPALTLVMTASSLVISPLQLAYSRRLIEHRADRYALNLTRQYDAFIGAMRKIGRLNLSDPHPPALVKLLLHSHPPLGERIAYAEWQRSGLH